MAAKIDAVSLQNQVSGKKVSDESDMIEPEVDKNMGYAETNILDPKGDRVGGMVAGMQIVSLTDFSGRVPPAARESVRVIFTGQVALSGMYEYFYSDFDGSEHVCIIPATEEEALKIPKFEGQDFSLQRFCFRNTEKAKKEFGPRYGEGVTSVIIDNFELQYVPGEALNYADLVSVSSKTATKF